LGIGLRDRKIEGLLRCCMLSFTVSMVWKGRAILTGDAFLPSLYLPSQISSVMELQSKSLVQIMNQRFIKLTKCRFNKHIRPIEPDISCCNNGESQEHKNLLHQESNQEVQKPSFPWTRLYHRINVAVIYRRVKMKNSPNSE
jgi:hypothetical protein